MNDIKQSMDDLPISKIYAKINRISNERFLFQKGKEQLIDSEIISVNEIEQYHNDKHNDRIIEPVSIVRKTAMARTGKDRDNPKMTTFDGSNWAQHNDQWQPAQIEATVNKTSANMLPAQSDSGANRIVTDDMTILKNVKIIEPYPMGAATRMTQLPSYAQPLAN